MNNKQIEAIISAYVCLTNKTTEKTAEKLIENFPFLEQEQQITKAEWELSNEFTSYQINALNNAYIELQSNDISAIPSTIHLATAFPFLAELKLVCPYCKKLN